MTNEEKKTLINAILGYLPYKLKVRYYDMEDSREEDAYIEGVSCYKNEITFDVDQYSIKAEGLKPYLRPIESMTDEEREEYNRLVFDYEYDDYWHPGKYVDAIAASVVDLLIDFYNKCHLDYRGLIPMGLALPAPEGMYNTKIE